MQIRHIFSELGTGLRRNMSMTVSLIVTMFVSLTMVGLAVLTSIQADRTDEYWADRLQIQVLLCAERTAVGECIDGAVTDTERSAVEEALDDNPEVESWEYNSQRDSYEQAKEMWSKNPTSEVSFNVTDVRDFHASYFVTLEDNAEYESVLSQVDGMGGVYGTVNLVEQLKPLYVALDWLWRLSVAVAGVLIIAAILQVSNTVRLTAYARRREIGIMRLVGASTWHIQLPFVLESLLAALLSSFLACLTIAAFIHFFINGVILDSAVKVMTDWVGWGEALTAGLFTVGVAVLLGLIPTLVMTRKYLNV